MAFNRPSATNTSAGGPPAGGPPAGRRPPARREAGPLPVIGKLPASQQFRILITLLALIAALAALVVVYDYRTATNGTAYISVAGDMRMLSQRIGKAAQTALSGQAEAFRQLRGASERFAGALALLMRGGDFGGAALPAASDASMPLVEALQKDWERLERDIALVLGQQKLLEKPAAGEAKTDGVAEPASDALGPTRAAARRLVEGSETLLASADKLIAAYQDELGRRSAHFAAMGALALLAAVLVWMMVRVYAGDQRRQALAADSQTRTTQAAIQRLMDDMQRLAEGDLTVKVPVTEDITGAIADSVNFTVEELRDLVGRINETAARVAAASDATREVSGQLLGAAEYQTREIRDTSTAMLGMASAMENMSSSTAQSAGVARTSLAAAQKGQVAVENAISGMNDIRGQIQETSKRIKRLGESSQEIGEIVELISDITDQTNVLALNAAIQAASAGEAGRGFAVVAEEVQRLAERSAGATKQIASIVKAIQSDTQEAVAAMEKSTQGVVEGTRLSDAVSQALSEIGAVSQQLAQLIEGISQGTQQQAATVTSLAANMQDILKITQQTTEGTQRTSQSVGVLARLALDLKDSVSRFRMDR